MEGSGVGGETGRGGAGAGAGVGAVGAEENQAVPEAGGADAVMGLGRVFSAFPVFFFFVLMELHVINYEKFGDGC